MPLNRLLCRMTRSRQIRRLADRWRAEDGGLYIMFLPMLAIMAIWGGIGVDMMRFESRRAMLQGVTDRAALAAANLGQSQTPSAVVTDYFLKAGMAPQLKSTVVNQSFQRRDVTVNSTYDMDTMFMRYLGPQFNTLAAPAVSSAVQGVGAVEVSLVLDLSGSMHNTISGTSTRRIAQLRTAAENFVNALLKPEYADRVSISLVPYSEHVNVGPEIFNLLNTNRVHNLSHCVELPAVAFTRVSFDLATQYAQTQNFQSNAFGYGDARVTSNPDLDQPVCPRFSYERIIPISQDKSALVAAIRQFQPRAGTSIFMGLKWGATLLDPSFRPVIAALPTGRISPAFAQRPEPYEADRSKGQTIAALKYIVLMTDGFNDQSFRLRPAAYDDPSERFYWAHHNLAWATSSTTGAPRFALLDYRESSPFYTAQIGDGYMNSMCTAAKNAGIIIYAISMTGDNTDPEFTQGRNVMAACASSSNHFFLTSGAELNAIFEKIAEQITDLRLTQ
ncbi:Putative Flp pilus-assembly TadE/G-like [Loktanella fryxellensis]|uniref:Putative Flp pilus-assembly TadE/G-like n=1 Tax=Loktanella fryxellensis TaxID=245187 RepID=A0A1H8HMN6_9RHOB|nr:Tad domain-containing protein [Loktanella fryxellensis]SEN57215.1 Putative Flp pilus-assembly TadE/G-like [Loktanella fryxellensis]